MPSRLTACCLLTGVLITACGPAEPRPDAAARLDGAAVAYVELVLGLGVHDANFVDAYYGPDSLRARAESAGRDVASIRASADSLAAAVGAMPAPDDAMLAMRRRYLVAQLGAVSARARMVGGEQLSFDDEARALYGVTVPTYTDAHFDSLRARLDALVPGRDPLAARYARFREAQAIPPARVDTVFKAAIAECRARTAARLVLPSGEDFSLEYVTGTPWNAYNWYKGGYHSLIQVNLDLPIQLDRAVDLACHEGYPGHHVYNALLEQSLVRDRGWVEVSVYPLFSPQSLIAEGSANYGIEMAFPGEERTAFERDVLLPLTPIPSGEAERIAAVREVVRELNHARNEVARRYLDGAIGADSAAALLQRWWLVDRSTAEKSVRFIDTYRSYVINYNLGRDLVAAWVEREGGGTADGRWAAFGRLLSSPMLPADLQ